MTPNSRADLIRRLDKSITIPAAADQSVAESALKESRSFSALWRELVALILPSSSK